MRGLSGPAMGPLHGGSLDAAAPQIDHTQRRDVRRMPPVAKAAPRQLTQAPLSQQEREELEALYEDQLLSALGLSSTTVAARLSGEGVQGAAISAWRELQQHAASNWDLSQLIRHHQSQQERDLDDMYQSLKNGAHGDQRKINELDRVDQSIREALPALMLFPETGLLRYLIDELETAAGPDDGQRPEEHVLLEQLRQVSELMGRSDLADADAWVRIRAALSEKARGDTPRIVRIPQRRPNNGSSKS